MDDKTDTAVLTKSHMYDIFKYKLYVSRGNYMLRDKLFGFKKNQQMKWLFSTMLHYGLKQI